MTGGETINQAVVADARQASLSVGSLDANAAASAEGAESKGQQPHQENAPQPH